MGEIDFKSAEKEMGAKCIFERYVNIPKCFRFLNAVHTSIRINKKISLPFKEIWKKYDSLNMIENGSILIITDSFAQKITIKDLNNLKKKNINIYLLFLNTAETTAGKYALELTQKFSFSHIFSIDQEDCNKFGFEYTNQVYFNCNKLGSKTESSKGLFFVGNNKGRLAILKK